jgi:polyhydroxyalkanoate synthesis regulator phasin
METKQEKTASAIPAFYQEWLNGQNKFMQNWMEAAQNFQKNAAGSLPEGSTAYYKQWADQQAAMYKSWMEIVEKFQAAFPAPTSFNSVPGFAAGEQSAKAFKDLMDAQMKYMSNFAPQGTLTNMPWLQSFSTNGQGFNPFNGLSSFRTSAIAQMFGLYENWLAIYKNFAATAGKNVQELTGKMPEGVAKETLGQILNSTESYMKLLEFWMPIYKSMQEKTVTPEQLQQYMHPARYKEVIDKVFEFVSPETLQEFYAHSAKLMEAVNSAAGTQLKQYNELSQRNTKLLPELMAGDPQAAMKIYENLYESYQRNFDPMLRATINGRDAEILEIMKSMVTKYHEFSQKFSKFQYNTYVTGQKAMEKVVEKVADMVKNGGELKSYNEFFKMWVEMNEKAYGELFKTEDFSKLQAELMNNGLEIRTELQRLMETYLADYPVVPRSEMDELYKTVHELKAKVRSLEKGEKVATTETADDKSGKKAVAAVAGKK